MILDRGGGASLEHLNKVMRAVIFSQRKKNYYIYSFKGRKKNHFGLKTQTKRTSVKVTWITSLLVNLGIQIYYRLKNLLDKNIVRHLGVSQQIVGIHFIVDWQQIFFSSLWLHK